MTSPSRQAAAPTPAMPRPPLTRDDCAALDAIDPLATMREAFVEAPDGRICLDGNSMGALPRTAPERILHAMRAEWSAHRRHAWTVSDWLDAPQRIGALYAPILGARAEDVIATDNTTIVLHKLLDYALRLVAGRDPARRTIVYEADGFPTDSHVVQGLVHHGGGRWQARPFATSADPAAMDAALDAALGPDVAVVVLSHGDYRSSHRWAMADTNRRVHEAGALTLWDLSHTAGSVPIGLEASGSDFATVCGYKYLCAGPGAPALAWIRPEHQDHGWPTLPGWLGHADRMHFVSRYEPASGPLSLVGGTMPVLQNVVMEAAATIWSGIAPADVHAKHRSLSTMLVRLLDERCGRFGVTLVSPADYDRRAGHVAFRCPGGGPVCEALLADGVIASFRQPDVIRFGLSVATIRHVDLWDAVSRLHAILAEERWRDPRFATVSV